MKTKNILSLLLLAVLPLMVSAQRVVEDFNFGWKFRPGVADVKNLNTDDWRTVDLPHDFQIEQPWVEPDVSERPDNSDGAANFKSRLSSRGFKEMGEGWYVKTFTPDATMQGKRVIVDFEGIMYVGDVYLNGELVGGTDYGYVGFEIDITKKLRYGEENTLAVRASTSKPTDSRWYTGGGIFRDVHLITTDAKLYFARHPLYITTKDNCEVNIQIEVANYTKAKTVTMQVDILDGKGQQVYSKRESLPFMRRMKLNELKWETITLDNPILWDTENPHLYTANVTLFDDKGKEVDRASHRFGVRTIEIGPEYGLKLNGKKVLLKGIANHHSLGALGAAVYPRAIEKRLKMLKEFGFNHVRTSHNPYSKSYLELCDELGFIVVDELYDKWLKNFTGGRRDWMEQWPTQLPEWIKQDRSHACVTAWSLGNELQTYAALPYGDWGVTPYRMMKELLLRYDNTRKVTVAMHPRGRNWETDSLPCDLAMVTDFQSYNYRYMYFPGDGRRFPWMTFYQSEANKSAMGPNFFEMDLDRVMGLAYWGAIDYLGESRGWPRKGWVDGAFDISLQPKPLAYLLASMFKEEPVVHIAVFGTDGKVETWNGVEFTADEISDHWNHAAGKSLTLKVYTNTERVELYLNGKKIAEKDNTTDPKTRNQISFENVVYEQGYLEAVAYNGGRRVATHRIETAGKMKRLALTADNLAWTADGYDLQHVRVTAVDRKGRRVPGANQKLQFSVEGDARIIAVDNGDMMSNEVHVANERSLYNGSALVILRAGKTAGKVRLTVRDNLGNKSSIDLQTMGQ